MASFMPACVSVQGRSPSDIGIEDFSPIRRIKIAFYLDKTCVSHFTTYSVAHIVDRVMNKKTEKCVIKLLLCALHNQSAFARDTATPFLRWSKRLQLLHLWIQQESTVCQYAYQQFYSMFWKLQINILKI
jgi:hypothetical protein